MQTRMKKQAHELFMSLWLVIYCWTKMKCFSWIFFWAFRYGWIINFQTFLFCVSSLQIWLYHELFSTLSALTVCLIALCLILVILGGTAIFSCFKMSIELLTFTCSCDIRWHLVELLRSSKKWSLNFWSLVSDAVQKINFFFSQISLGLKRADGLSWEREIGSWFVIEFLLEP